MRKIKIDFQRTRAQATMGMANKNLINWNEFWCEAEQKSPARLSSQRELMILKKFYSI